MQYVGKTETTLYTRLNNTRSEVTNYNKNKPNIKILPYTTHFNLPGHSVHNINITGIEIVKTKQHDTIMKRESHWISKLQTLRPRGINADQ